MLADSNKSHLVRKKVFVVVLGDIGRSPRMQYHAISLINSGFLVTLIGYNETPTFPEILNSKIVIKNVKKFPLSFCGASKILLYILKAVWLFISLFTVLMFSGCSDFLILQNPPSIPTIPVCWLYCVLTRCKLIIDWHNLGYSVIKYNEKKYNYLTYITAWVEKFFGQLAYSSICVSNAMKVNLEERWNIRATTFYDRPVKAITSLSMDNRHDVFLELAELYPSIFGVSSSTKTKFIKLSSLGMLVGQNHRPGLIVSSTSWSEDEDFNILMMALDGNSKFFNNPKMFSEYEKVKNLKGSMYPKLICLVTGKGPKQHFYTEQIIKRNWKHIKFCTLWLELSLYKKVLAVADLGVCLHVSTSGLDLPMKIVDMFSCQLPVCALRYQCINELVQDGINGFLFENCHQLSSQILNYFHNFPINKTQNKLHFKLKSNLKYFSEQHWADHWNSVVLYILKQISHLIKIIRLDRLFSLLENGSSPITRKAAAQQLGQVVKAHPHDLHLLLSRVLQYLQSQVWETRIAGGQAIEAILSNIPKWNPTSINDNPTGNIISEELLGISKLQLCKFDLEWVLKDGQRLVATDTSTYEFENAKNEDANKQRINVIKHLGLDFAEQLEIDLSDIITNEDLTNTKDSFEKNEYFAPVNDILDQDMQLMSNRERNYAKRKAKLLAKQQIRDTASSSDNSDECIHKRRKNNNDDDVIIKFQEGSWNELEPQVGEWPLEKFCHELCCNLFSPNWEIRHGAALALREVLKNHGENAGKKDGLNAMDMEYIHQVWLEDVALRLLCLLALDRFGDFISDQVVAPVRESAAQGIGCLVRYLHATKVNSIVHLLLQLLDQEEWEPRHGGLLGLKYILAVRQDLASDLVPLSFPKLFQCLSDPVDDVTAIAAAALTPVSSTLPTLVPDGVISTLNKLWESLLDLDELTSSTKSIMALLSSLLASFPVSLFKNMNSGSYLPTRLFPFLYHSSSSVRQAALETLITLTSDKRSMFSWEQLFQPTLQHMFQRALIEPKHEIAQLTYIVFHNCILRSHPNLIWSIAPHISSWLCLLVTPSKIALDNNLLMLCLNKSAVHQIDGRKIETVFYLGSNNTDTCTGQDKMAFMARLMGAKLLGLLSIFLTKESSKEQFEIYSKLLLAYVESKNALHRQVVSLILCEWANQVSEQSIFNLFELPQFFQYGLHQALTQNVYYDEIALLFTQLQAATRDTLALAHHHNILDVATGGNCVYTLEQIEEFYKKIDVSVNSMHHSKRKHLEALLQKKKEMMNLYEQTQAEYANLHLTTQACLASAVVSLNCLPDKLNPIIKPLMNSLEHEESEQLQLLSAQCLSHLMLKCVERIPCPNSKIIRNLCSAFYTDPNLVELTECFSISFVSNDKQISNAILTEQDDIFNIIWILRKMEVNGKSAVRRSKSSKTLSSTDKTEREMGEQQNIKIKLRGVEIGLQNIFKTFGSSIPRSLPYLWDLLINVAKNIKVVEKGDLNSLYANKMKFQSAIQNLRLFELTCTWLHKDLIDQFHSVLYEIVNLLSHPLSPIRHIAARSLAAASNIMTHDVMTLVIDQVLPWLGCSDCDVKRKGAIEALHFLMEVLNIRIAPYIVLLIIPVLGRISDPDIYIRMLSSQCFATLIRIMPLDCAIPDPPQLSSYLIKQKEKQQNFIEQLFNIKLMQNYEIPVIINAELRKYQKEGVNWLAFLNKYNLHGILCDDMGLGKTLQSICILVGDHYFHKREHELIGSELSVCLPSLVICPPTLVGHWIYEVEKFVNKKYFRALLYSGSPTERQRLWEHLDSYNLIVASYDIVRNDINLFADKFWNYCILDEGHVIKNGKTKMAKAIKRIVANHRIILSGTPVQNNVLELWSLFDFLMPGYLGTERQFNASYSKLILQSRDAKSCSHEQEAGALALEKLHRQVLPFLLRRVKEQVLDDLPPKITQDYYCDLSPLQKQLYEDFSKIQSWQVSGDSHTSFKRMHIFQALQYLRKVCNHPKLVLVPNHPHYQEIMKDLYASKSSLSCIEHASKLLALKQLLLDCCIGVQSDMGEAEAIVSQHRALIFCQLKVMLDIIEYDLFKVHMPSVTYLRLDGSIPAAQRFEIVSRFNNDPSIDLLLLTTQVGGLGLSLTGADTVIFVEHDWNPMKDLQAMDRAHRIGQRKVVNVYRLITKGTLEEKIMSLQKFKIKTANTVISIENSSLTSMGTEKLLDLFSLDNKHTCSEITSSYNVASYKDIFYGLTDLWDEKLYDEEFDLDTFLSSFKNSTV